MSIALAFVSMPSGPEWLIIAFVFLLLFGAKKLPELARSIGRSLGEFRKAKIEFEREIQRAADEADREAAKKKDEPGSTQSKS